eukprot:183361-Rhodomonas_salina.2
MVLHARYGMLGTELGMRGTELRRMVLHNRYGMRGTELRVWRYRSRPTIRDPPLAPLASRTPYPILLPYAATVLL